METARDESCPDCQLRGLVAAGDDMVSSPDEKSFNSHKTPTSWGLKRRSPGSIPPRTVWKSQPHWLVAVSWSLRAGRDVPLANVEVPPHQDRMRSSPRIGKSFICLQPKQLGSRDGDYPGQYRPLGYGNPNPTERTLVSSPFRR